MSQQYDNELKGVLFKNDKKEKDTHPDYKGSAEVEGKKYWLAAWINTSKDDVKYMSLKFEAQDEERESRKPEPAKAATTTRKSNVDGLDDDIPF